jgi:hypothetical protein
MAVRVASCDSAVRLLCSSAAVCGSVRQCAAVCERLCAAVRAAVCVQYLVWGSVHGTSLRAVCTVRAAVCGSALGSV